MIHFLRVDTNVAVRRSAVVDCHVTSGVGPISTSTQSVIVTNKPATTETTENIF